MPANASITRVVHGEKVVARWSLVRVLGNEVMKGDLIFTLVLKLVHCEVVSTRRRVGKERNSPEPHSGQRLFLPSERLIQRSSCDSAGLPVHPMTRVWSYSRLGWPSAAREVFVRDVRKR